MFLDAPMLPIRKSELALRVAIKPSLTTTERDLIDAVSKGERSIRQRENAQIIARPMRELFDLLATGEVFELDGQAIMQMPEFADTTHTGLTEWIEIAPAIEGWRDCWQRIAPDISTYHMGVLAKTLAADKPITPRLVEKARAEFESTIARICELPPGALDSGVRTTEIAWIFEKQAAEAGDSIQGEQQ